MRVRYPPVRCDYTSSATARLQIHTIHAGHHTDTNPRKLGMQNTFSLICTYDMMHITRGVYALIHSKFRRKIDNAQQIQNLLIE